MVSTTIRANDVRVALVIKQRGSDEEILTRFVRPGGLASELMAIKEHESWYIAETFLANGCGQKVEV